HQLAVKLPAAAARHAGALPASLRAPFVAGFRHAAGRGVEAGAGVPAGLPAPLRQVFIATFRDGYVGAMRVSLVLPVALIGLAALACLTARRRRPDVDPVPVVRPSRGPRHLRTLRNDPGTTYRPARVVVGRHRLRQRVPGEPEALVASR